MSPVWIIEGQRGENRVSRRSRRAERCFSALLRAVVWHEQSMRELGGGTRDADRRLYQRARELALIRGERAAQRGR